ncbi:integrase [Streptomyces sp. NL15-2K]|nr:hypothetical protein [Kutzneria buriramensis]WKX09155.1 hypothetical protein Q4V64_17300 [Kutzneria buriramensis]GCB49339.1 integrase [Streptomyces sp. NL15-2K]
MNDYLTYWLNSIAIHRLRENTHTRYAACVRLHLTPSLGTAKDVRAFLDRLRTTASRCVLSDVRLVSASDAGVESGA